MTAVVVITVGVLLGAGLVISQLVRLKEWLGRSPPDPPSESPAEPTE